jgi:hypothetical protein
MENRINRLLRPGEVVHHRDFDKLNNAIENLELMSDSNHNRLHRLLEYRSRRQ